MQLLTGKTAIVTGGSKGIGEAIVKKLASQGSDVVFTYQSNEIKAKQVEQYCIDLGVQCVAIRSDASSFEQSATLINEVIERFQKIDILVNNAGITRDNLLLRMSEEQWDEVQKVNLKSIFNLTKHASRYFLKQKSGSIINLTSIVGMKGQAGQANYAASKAGIIGFTKSVADELGSRGVRCNAIAPGFIQTDMTDTLTDELKSQYFKQIPMQRFGTADEVANTVLFLASDMSSYISGQVISVCGALNR